LTVAVLANQFHVILRNRPDVVARWDDTEVARRWLSNHEDQATGRFFEERYRATRLLDEASVLACSAYVDLNPIRAALCETIESSDHTSAKLRIESMRQENSADRLAASSPGEPIEPIRKRPDAMLSPVSIDERTDPIGPCIAATGDRCSEKGYLSMSVLDYVELLDWTARQSRSAPSGRTPRDMPPLLKRLGLSASAWCELVGRFGRLFHHVAGCPESIDRLRGHRRGGRFRVNRRVRELMPARE